MMLTEDEFFIPQLYRRTAGTIVRDGSPNVRWWFFFRDTRIEMGTKQIISQRRFRNAVFRATGEMPPLRAPPNFRRWLDGLMQNCIEQENADPVQRTGIDD